jgi:hypothetical protein
VVQAPGCANIAGAVLWMLQVKPTGRIGRKSALESAFVAGAGRSGYGDSVEMSERPEATAESESVGATEAEFRLVAPNYADIPATYSNFAQATVSQHDLTIFFGWYATPPLTEPPTEPIEIPVRPLMAVSIPIGIIRPLIRVLEAQAAAWEQTHGQKLGEQAAPADKEDG